MIEIVQTIEMNHDHNDKNCIKRRQLIERGDNDDMTVSTSHGTKDENTKIFA